MVEPPRSDDNALGVFQRNLTIWIALAIVLGIAIGSVAPGLVEVVAAAEVASINLVVTVLIWGQSDYLMDCNSERVESVEALFERVNSLKAT